MRQNRWIRPPKLIALGAAVAVGVFLSVASHAFDWSEGSTFAVACALVALLALFGPALFLLEETEPNAEPSTYSLQPSQPDATGRVPFAGAYFSRLQTEDSRAQAEEVLLAYRALMETDSRASRHLNRREDIAYVEAAAREKPRSRDLPRGGAEYDLGRFIALAGKQRESVDTANVGLFRTPREVVLMGQHG